MLLGFLAIGSKVYNNFQVEYKLPIIRVNGVGRMTCILTFSICFILSECVLMADPAKALRMSGTGHRTKFDIDGKTVRTQHQDEIQMEIDDTGKWLLTSISTAVPQKKISIGYDGTNTIKMEYLSGEFQYEGNTNKTIVLSNDNATALCSIYSGNEFPFDLWPPSKFAWFVLASRQYLTETNRQGRLGDLFKSLEFMPIRYALRAKPSYRSEWPQIMEAAELYFDINGYPKDPIGVTLPDNEKDYRTAQESWGRLKEKASGVKVGTMRSMNPKTLNGWTLPSRYVLEVSWRGSEAPDNTVGIDNIKDQMVLDIMELQPIDSVVGRPKFVGPGVLVKDYRFRYVDQSTAMEYLAYEITDKRWKSVDDKTLKMRALHNRSQSPRFGNARNQFYKYIGVVALVLVFSFPFLVGVVRLFKSKNKNEKS